MNADERSRQWYSMRERSRVLLDGLADFKPEPVPERRQWQVPEPEPEKMQSPPKMAETTPKLDAPPLIDVHAEIAAAVEAALESEREFVFQVVGESLGEMLRDQRQESKDELAAEVRKLWAVLTEMQVTLAALARLGVMKATEPLDLPSLPRRERREIN